MKITQNIFYLMFALILTSGIQAQHENHQMQEKSTNKEDLSPHTSTMAMIGGAHIHIDYSSPRVRDRIIFGGLVGYNTVWQAGAHKATWMETDKDLVIDNQTLPAGRYGFFVIPGKENWTVIFNSNWDQHGKDEFDENENILTMEVPIEKLEEIQEVLVYEVKKEDEDKGVISLAWEKIKIKVPFQVVNK